MRSDLHIARDLFESLLSKQIKFQVTGPELEIYNQRGDAFYSIDYDIWDGVRWIPFITLAIKCEDASLIELSGTDWTKFDLSQPDSSKQITDTLIKEIANLLLHRRFYGITPKSALPEMRDEASLPSHSSPKTST